MYLLYSCIYFCMAVLFNFLLPVSILLSFSVIIYAIILFLSSINGGNKCNRTKALKVIIVPVVYLCLILIVLLVKRAEANKRIAKELSGVYQYHVDTLVSYVNPALESRFTIKNDFTYSYYNNFHGDTSFIGTWKAAEDPSSFLLCNDKGAKLWIVKWQKQSKKTVLSIVQNCSVINFIKEN